MDNKPFVLILCGGKSLRLWPLSEYKSKNFLDVFGFSPLELTIKRFLKVTPADNIFLVANQKEKKALAKIKLVKKSNIFFEPESKNTAAAVILALQHLKKRSHKSIIISPVDHLINKEKEFYRALKKALGAAKDGWICTVGIKPLKPTPNFGYIQVQKKEVKGIFSVKRFIEKPTSALANKLINKGGCFYNSGMFISSISTLIGEYKKYYLCYDDFTADFDKKNIASLYRRIDSIPFDKAIMEKTKKAKLVRGNFFWKDFGSWHAVYEVLSKDKEANVRGRDVFTYKSKNNLIYPGNSGKKILAVGLEDIFFIDTEGYTLVASRSHLDELKLALGSISKTAKSTKEGL